jgi:hypothetical protein
MQSRCVLCRSCANSTRRQKGRERRRPERICAAGIPESDNVFECASYITVDTVIPLRTRLTAALADRS